MRAEPVVLSWSGGKDSALALAALRADPRFDVVALLTTVTAGYDRISIHGVRRSLLERQIEALRLPLHEIELQPSSSNEQYEAALERALQGIRQRHPEVRRVAFGDLFLEDVRQYREDRLPRLGFQCLFPIWGRPTDQLAEEFIDAARESAADAILVSSLYGMARIDCSDFGAKCEEAGIGHVKRYLGGILVTDPEAWEETERLFKAQGFHRVYPPQTKTEVAIADLKSDLDLE